VRCVHEDPSTLGVLADPQSLGPTLGELARDRFGEPAHGALDRVTFVAMVQGHPVGRRHEVGHVVDAQGAVDLREGTLGRRAALDARHEQLPDGRPHPADASERTRLGGRIMGEPRQDLITALPMEQGVLVQPRERRTERGQMLSHLSPVELEGVDERQAVLERRLVAVRRRVAVRQRRGCGDAVVRGGGMGRHGTRGGSGHCNHSCMFDRLPAREYAGTSDM